MKFLFAFLLLSSASAEEKTVCKSIGDVFYKGPAILIDNDSSGSVLTQGDVFIADTLQVAGSVSTFPSIKAICTLTAVNPLDEGAFCTLEITLSDGKIMAMGTLPELVVTGGTGAYYRASGAMTTAENFEESIGFGFIGLNARIDFCVPITIPPTPECQDDKNWSTLYNEKEINCEWVGRNRLKRCSKVETASTACPVTCGTCPVALPFE